LAKHKTERGGVIESGGEVQVSATYT